MWLMIAKEIKKGMEERKVITTQLQPTPVLYGEDADAVLEQINTKPTKR